MPRMVVRMKPDGSLSPGMMNFAMTPAMKPIMIVQIMPMSPLRANALTGGLSWEASIRRIFVHGCRQFTSQSVDNLLLRKAGLLFQLLKNFRSDGLLKFWRGPFPVRTLIHP